MRIDESIVFVFQFDTNDMGGVTFPMRAKTREEAADNLQKCLMRIQSELAMEFPKTSPAVSTNTSGPLPVAAADGLSDILLERIDALLGTLGASGLNTEAKAATVKKWTELDFTPANYAQIVHAFELIASGGKDVEPPKPKKK